MLLDALLPAIRYLLSGVAAKDIPAPAVPPVAKGEPAMAVSPPVDGLIENALMLLLPSFATYRVLPAAQIVIRFEANNPPGLPMSPVGNGEPGSGVSAPFEATENADTLVTTSSLFVYTKL